MSFWYHIAPAGIERMPLAMIEAYMERLPARIAEMQMAMAGPASLPHMDEAGRRKTLEQWQTQSEGGERKAQPPLDSTPVEAAVAAHAATALVTPCMRSRLTRVLRNLVRGTM